MPAIYGLIGYPLSHSFSPAYFASKFEQEAIDAVYNAYPLKAIQELPALIRNNKELAGLNVTIPYKQSVMQYLDEMDDAAKEIGAVNCIAIDNCKLKGYNTDYIGFTNSLQRMLTVHHNKALVLGTGGASKAVVYALQQLGILYKLVSRTNGDFQYKDLTDDIVQDYKLIINTTPLGTYPDVEGSPAIPYHAIGATHLLYDLVYNPEETTFLRLGKAQGAITKNGYEMLVLQAEASWHIWNANR